MRIIIPIIALVTAVCWLLTPRAEQTDYLPAPPEAVTAWARINAAAAVERQSLEPAATQPAVLVSDAVAIENNSAKPATRPAGS